MSKEKLIEMKNISYHRTILAMLVILSLCCFQDTALAQSSNKIAKPKEVIINPTSASAEADMMASMAGIACIFKDWQTVYNPDSSAFMRGYNIGSILIDWRGDTTVTYALNSVGCFHNGTQHGEVRAMQQHTFCNDLYYLDSCTIYTNLEPCAMCAGMMCLEKVNRAVYAQHDPCFGGALQRLSDSTQAYLPYPRITTPEPSDLMFYQEINAAYDQYCGKQSDSCDCNIVAFLASDLAYNYYYAWTIAFLNYQVIYSENQNLYNNLLEVYNSVIPSNGSCSKVTLPTSCSCECFSTAGGINGSLNHKNSQRRGYDKTPPGHRR